MSTCPACQSPLPVLAIECPSCHRDLLPPPKEVNDGWEFSAAADLILLIGAIIGMLVAVVSGVVGLSVLLVAPFTARISLSDWFLYLLGYSATFGLSAALTIVFMRVAHMPRRQ